jgi:hypothetical protein
VQAGVDDLHPRVAQRPRDDLGTAIVPVETRLGDDDTYLSGHKEEYRSLFLRKISPDKHV